MRSGALFGMRELVCAKSVRLVAAGLYLAAATLLGIAHHPLAISSTSADASYGTLPDGTVIVLCAPSGDPSESRDGKASAEPCGACLIAQGAALPAPCPSPGVVREDLAVVFSAPTWLPPSRGPPLGLPGARAPPRPVAII